MTTPKPQFTPGPWMIDATDKEHNFIHAGGSRCIASVDNSDDEDRNNARLIAAAPELLEACKTWLEMEAEAHAEERAHDTEGCHFCETYAPVAKAKGE